MGTIKTDFLFSDSGFLTGMATAVNLAGNFYDFNRSRTPKEADSRALTSDWLKVGEDISECAEKVRIEADV